MAMDFTKSNTSTKLKQIQQKSTENSNRIVAIDIPLEEIDKNPDNDKIFNMDEIELLAKSIGEEGFSGAIEVYKKPDGRYEISAGHRRYEAMKMLKKPTIPCIVKEIPNDFVKGKKLLLSNVLNRKLTPLDMAKAIDYYDKLLTQAGEKKNFIRQAMEFFGMSYPQVYRFQCLLKLIPELQNLANDPNFPFSAFRGAAMLTEDGQKELYNQLKYFISNPEDRREGEDELDDKEMKLTRPRIEQMIENIRMKEEYQARPLPKIKKEKKEPVVPEPMIPEEIQKQFGITAIERVEEYQTEEEFEDTEEIVENINEVEEGIEDEKLPIKEDRIKLNKLLNSVYDVVSSNNLSREELEESLSYLENILQLIKSNLE